MSATHWVLLSVAATLALYALFVAVLYLTGRGTMARDLARFIPDCLVLYRRLVADPRVSRRNKLLLAALAGYLAMPFDLVPDFIPVAGQLDDAIVVALVLRAVVRGSGPALVKEHWPGSPASVATLLRIVGSRA
jgi:uncharacterized membrane protein YkvA (DUF1232 family)